jgi:hypothetical protein
MRRSIPLLPLLVCLYALAALPAGAAANATDERIAAQCERGPPLNETYTKAQLRHARRNLSADVLEYSGCYDAILAALREPSNGAGRGDGGTGSDISAGVGGTSSSGSSGDGGGIGGGSGAPESPQHVGTEAPVAIAGAAIEPGELPSIGQDANELPDALVVLLSLLGLAALAAAALTIGRRVVDRRRA